MTVQDVARATTAGEDVAYRLRCATRLVPRLNGKVRPGGCYKGSGQATGRESGGTRWGSAQGNATPHHVWAVGALVDPGP